MHSFTPRDTQSHIQCIKKLQTIVVDLDAFIHCLTILATQETRLDDLMIDLYIYYANIGLAMPNPRLRAGTIAMLNALLPTAQSLMIPMLEQLEKLARDETWWEIRIHLLTFCGSILDNYQHTKSPRDGSWNSDMHRNRETNGFDIGSGDQESKYDGESIIMPSVMRILNNIFHSKMPRYVRMWGLVSLSRATCYGDRIVQPYLNVMQSLNDDDQKFLYN